MLQLFSEILIALISTASCIFHAGKGEWIFFSIELIICVMSIIATYLTYKDWRKKK